MAVPDVTRQWSFPKPTGDNWVFDFPFTVAGKEVQLMYVYLKTVFEAYGEGSSEDFIARNIRLTIQTNQNGQFFILKMRTWLAPYDLGISQDVTLTALPTGDHNIYKIEVTLNRLSGDIASWQRMNRNFLNVLRKRFLVWRTLPTSTRLIYQSKLASSFEKAVATI